MIDVRCKYFDDNGNERGRGCFSKREGRPCKFVHPEDRDRWSRARSYEVRAPFGGDRGGWRGRGRGGGGNWGDRSTYVDRDRDGGTFPERDNTRRNVSSWDREEPNSASTGPSSGGGWGAPERASSGWNTSPSEDRSRSTSNTSKGWAAAVDAASSSGRSDVLTTASSGGWAASVDAAPSGGWVASVDAAPSGGWAASVDAAPSGERKDTAETSSSGGWATVLDDAKGSSTASKDDGGWGISSKDLIPWGTVPKEVSARDAVGKDAGGWGGWNSSSNSTGGQWGSSSNSTGGQWGTSSNNTGGQWVSNNSDTRKEPVGSENASGNVPAKTPAPSENTGDGGQGSSNANQGEWGTTRNSDGWSNASKEGGLASASSNSWGQSNGNNGWGSSNNNVTRGVSTQVKDKAWAVPDERSPVEPTSAGPTRRNSEQEDLWGRRRQSTGGGSGTGTNPSINDSGWPQRRQSTQQQSPRSPENSWPRTDGPSAAWNMSPIHQLNYQDDQPPAKKRLVERRASGAMSPPAYVPERTGREDQLSQWVETQEHEPHARSGGSRPVAEETFSTIFEKLQTETPQGASVSRSVLHTRASVPVSSASESSRLQDWEGSQDYFELFEKAVLAKQEWEEAKSADEATRQYLHSKRFTKSSWNTTNRLESLRAETVKRVGQAKKNLDKLVDALAALPEPEPLMEDEQHKPELQEPDIDDAEYEKYLEDMGTWVNDIRTMVQNVIEEFAVLSRPRASQNELAMLDQLVQKVEMLKVELAHVEDEISFEEFQEQLVTRADALAGELAQGEDEEITTRLDFLHDAHESRTKELDAAISQDGTASQVIRLEKQDEEARTVIIDTNEVLGTRLDQWLRDIRYWQSQIPAFTEQAQQLEDGIRKLGIELREVRNPDIQTKQHVEEIYPIVLSYIQPYLEAIKSMVTQTLKAQEDNLKLEAERAMAMASHLIETCHTHLKVRGFINAAKNS